MYAVLAENKQLQKHLEDLQKEESDIQAYM
jgi:hypothetical protein